MTKAETLLALHAEYCGCTHPRAPACCTSWAGVVELGAAYDAGAAAERAAVVEWLRRNENGFDLGPGTSVTLLAAGTAIEAGHHHGESK